MEVFTINKYGGIYCITLNKIYNSVTDAVRDLGDISTGVASSSIIRCCKGEISKGGRLNETAEQLEWVYLSDFAKGVVPCIEKDKQKWLVCITTGQIFKSQAEACSFFNVGYSRISIQLSGKRPTAGFHPETNEPLIFERYLDYIKTRV